MGVLQLLLAQARESVEEERLYDIGMQAMREAYPEVVCGDVDRGMPQGLRWLLAAGVI